MNNTQWHQLVATYLPTVELSRTSPWKDEFMPSSIDWYLQRASMRDHTDSSFRIVHPSREDLANNPERSRYLEPDSEAVYPGDSSTAVMYVHIRNATDPAGIADEGWLDIQYWFFYPYNGGMGGPVPVLGFGTHQGDWERVTVRVSNWRDLDNGVVEAVFFAAHGKTEGKWLVQQSAEPKSGHYTLVDGKHPLVFSAYHSHASYESHGLHARKITYYWGNDYCSGGRTWGPDTKAEIMAIDDDVYASGDERVASPGWIEFTGAWGKKGSPRTPPQHSVWADDLDNGFYVSLEQLDTFGDGWGDSHGTTAVALGWLENESVLAVSRSGGSNDRFFVFDRSGDELRQIAAGGSSWGNGRSATDIALGVFANQQVLGVTRSKGDNSRFKLYTLADGVLTPLSSGGDSWGSSRAATAIAFGRLAEQQVVGVTRDSGDHQRFEIHTWTNGALELLASGGDSWGKSYGATDIAFGRLDGRQVVGVTRSSGDHQRFEIHAWEDGQLTLLSSGGNEWGDSRGATAIAFGILGGVEVVGVTRTKGDNARFYIYHRSNGALVEHYQGGTDWGSSHGATDIAFGMVNGRCYFAVSRTADDNARVFLYEEVDGQVVERGVIGDGWGNGRDGTCVTLGELDGVPVVGYGRSAGNHQRGGILNWTT